ncbi:hypothetical protein CDIK_2860 [Cucumispora dikerogammari]|nr:hypothetical protein CDIK_2860 [Cucumispora dikerogammari]
MLVLICDLLFISCSCDCEAEEMYDLRIVECVNEAGDLADTVFFSDKSSCSLKLLYYKNMFKFYICLHIGTVLNTEIVVRVKYGELLKCTENIVMGGCNNDFALKHSRDDKQTSYKTYSSRTDPGFIFPYSFEHESILPYIMDSGKVKNISKINKETYDDYILSTSINKFRKDLVINRNEIKTSVFKFRFMYRVYYEDHVNSKDIAFETERFGFVLNEEGKLVLNKQKKLERCEKNSELN